MSQTYPRYERAPRGHKVDTLRQGRLSGFISQDQWKDINLRSVLYKAKHPDNVSLEVYSAPDLSRPSFKTATKETFKPAKVGESFGPSWTTHWFRVTIDVPKYGDKLEFHWDANSEGMIYTEDGEPVHGLTGGDGVDRRAEFIIPKAWSGKKVFYVEASMNGMFGCTPGSDIIQPPIMDRLYTLKTAELVEPDVAAWDLYWDFLVLSEVAKAMPPTSWQAQKCISVSNHIINTFRREDSSSFAACREVAKEILGQVDKKKVKETIVWAIGHCHIDTAWLWPFGETRRKTARSWATQIDLMERYPEHHFTASQAQQYKWLKEDYPGLFEKIKKWVKKGNFIPIGGSWVESDTNFPSGESLARQLLYGQRYFEKEFGMRSKIYWLPDTFGYSSQLPQLLRLADMPYFFTQKLSWNNVNKFPNSTFNWVGLDGSQTLCHMAPSDTYNAQVSASELLMSVSNHGNLAEDKRSLLLFGNGDGGGGPLAEMLEKSRRFEALSDTMGGIPRMHVAESLDDFYEEIERSSHKGKDLTTWHGELYLEFHRGTYTSQAKTKRHNRDMETLLRQIEYFCAAAHLQGMAYPHKVIEEIWEDILLCQFHDVLPGSCIEMVYQDTEPLYAKAYEKGKTLLDKAQKHLGLGQGSQTVLNTLAWPRSEIVKATDVSAFSTSQKTQDGSFVPAMSNGIGCSAISDFQYTPVTVETKGDNYILKNSQVQATIKGGQLVSFIDLGLGRELIPEGAIGNRLVLHDDQPLYWDAWDVEIHHLEKFDHITPGKVTILDKGPLRASLLVEQRISKDSWIKSTISLDAVLNGASYTSGFNDALSQLEVSCEVEWNENRKFLKVEFPWDLHNDTADYETQFGIVRRPTHFNTSWDAAKFEVVCHKFANLDEFGYGVAILNDSKYGFATHGNVMRLSLLRSSKAPDAHADIGRQHFRYAILPHRGGLNESAVVRAGFNFNNPMEIVQGSSKLPNFTVDQAPNVVLETIKKAEDSGDIIVRVYESYGGAAQAAVRTSLNVKKCLKVNILEEEMSALDVSHKDGESIITLPFKAFEVVTLRLTVA